MHLTLKREVTKPAAKNLLQQQGRFDRFIHEFNHERPHQGIGMKYPAELYVSSSRPYRGIGDPEYPFHDRTITVTCCGRICIGRRKINLSTVFAGQNVGIKQVDERIWLVSFMDYDLGYFDDETCRLEPLQNPFGPVTSTFGGWRSIQLSYGCVPSCLRGAYAGFLRVRGLQARISQVLILQAPFDLLPVRSGLTRAFGGQRSIQLSYGCMGQIGWPGPYRSRRQGSTRAFNPGPAGADRLPAEPNRASGVYAREPGSCGLRAS